MAAELARRVYWLNSSRHIGALCDVLTRAGIDPGRWTAHDLVDRLSSFMAEQGSTFPDTPGNPLGFLRWLLTAAITEDVEAPGERRRRAAAEREARIERARREREQTAALLARIAEQREEIERIKAEMNRNYRRGSS